MGCGMRCLTETCFGLRGAGGLLSLSTLAQSASGLGEIEFLGRPSSALPRLGFS
jgi:hypothetical protein